MIKRFFKNLQFLFKPSFWSLHESYCEEWDRELNALLDHYCFINISTYTATLGGKHIWVANYPYSCFHEINKSVRPSRLTILRAKKQLEIDTNIAKILGTRPEPIVHVSENNNLENLATRIEELRFMLDNMPHNFSHYNKKENELIGYNKVKKHKFINNYDRAS